MANPAGGDILTATDSVVHWIRKWRPDLPPAQRQPRQLPGWSVRMAIASILAGFGVFACAETLIVLGRPLWIRCRLVGQLTTTNWRTYQHRTANQRSHSRPGGPARRTGRGAGRHRTIEDALRLAREAELDLVEVAPMARPPVAKLMDYGKFKYENAQKARESRRNQTNTVIKEMKLRPKIDSHDYETKKGHVVRFLKAGDKVKITIMFRGREQSRPELGYNLLKKLAADVDEYGFVESSPKQDGRNMLMVLGPHKKKTEARAEVKAERDRRAAERLADAEAEHTEQADRRAQAAAQPAAKKRRGPADNLDPDIDLS